VEKVRRPGRESRRPLCPARGDLAATVAHGSAGEARGRVLALPFTRKSAQYMGDSQPAWQKVSVNGSPLPRCTGERVGVRGMPRRTAIDSPLILTFSPHRGEKESNSATFLQPGRRDGPR